MEYDDKNNVHKRRREGWEFTGGRLPDFDAPVIDEGKRWRNRRGWFGLVNTKEIVEQRDGITVVSQKIK